MIKYLAIILLFLTQISFAQTQPSGFPTQFNNGWQQWGYQQSTLGTIIAKRDTNWLPRFNGTIVFRPQNIRPYFYDSTALRWFKLFSEPDTLTTLATRYDLTQISFPVLANNGLSKNGDTVQLGQTVSAVGNPANLNTNREIPTNGFSVFFTGTGRVAIGTTTPNSTHKFTSVATGTDRAIQATAASGVAVNGSSTGNAIVGQSTGTGISVQGTTVGAGIGVQGSSGVGGIGGRFTSIASGGTADPVSLELQRDPTGIGVSNGVGQTIMFRLPFSNATTGNESGRITNSFSNATSGAQSSTFGFHLMNNAVSARKALLASTGQWTWDGYPALTAQTDSATYKPIGIDGSGNVVRMNSWIGDGGGSISLNNIGSGYRWLATSTGNFKTVVASNTILWDSTSNSNALTAKVDTSIISSLYAMRDSTRRPDFLDSIYKKSSWSDLSDFVNNSSGGTVTSGNIVFTGGAGNFSKTLDYNYYTCLNHWLMVGGFKITGSSTGPGIGLHSTNSFFPHNILLQFNSSNGNLVIWQDGGVVATSATTLSYTNGDSIELSIERRGNMIFAYGRNTTTNAARVTVNAQLGLGFASVPNTGRFAIYNIGSSFTLFRLNVTSIESKNIDLMCIGDSKTAGYNATYPQLAFTYLLNQNYNVSIEAGPADITQSIKDLLPEIIMLRPRQALVCIGVNDIAFGISTATWNANILYIDSALQANGIPTRWINSLYDLTNSATLAAYINSALPANRVIDCYTAGNQPGTVAADNVHPTDFGHYIAYQAIINSWKLLYGNSDNPRDSLFNSTRTVKNIYMAAATAPSTISDGDVILPADGAITAWAGATNRRGRIIPFSQSGFVEYRNYHFGSTGESSHNFYIPNGSIGTQRIGTLFLNNGDVGHLGTLLTGTNSIGASSYPTGFTAGAGDIIIPVDRAIGATTGGATQRGVYIPFTNQGVSEHRNYFFSSTSHKSHSFFTPNGSTNTQQQSLYLTDDAKVHVPVADSSASPINVMWLNASTKEIQIGPYPTSATTLYTGDGTLAGNRSVNANNLNLTFNDVNTFRINHDVFVQSKADGTFPYSNVIVAPAQQLWFGYTPTAGTYSKGAGIIIDTNNNVSIGSGIITSSAPLYTAGSAFVQGFQSSQGNFYRVTDITADQTLGTAHYWVNVDATGGNITVTLPAASTVFGASMGIQYVIRRVDNSGNTVTVQRNGTPGTDTINGATSFTLTTQYEVKEVQATSTSTFALK